MNDCILQAGIGPGGRWTWSAPTDLHRIYIDPETWIDQVRVKDPNVTDPAPYGRAARLVRTGQATVAMECDAGLLSCYRVQTAAGPLLVGDKQLFDDEFFNT